MVFKAGEGSGQSGSFFFFSKDKRFIIKTLRGKEKEVLISMLDDMIIHFKRTENKSFLAKIYALYTIKTNVFRPLDIILMQNTAILKGNDTSKMCFDLKGSLYKRYSKLGENTKFWNKNMNFNKILKDKNVLEIN